MRIKDNDHIQVIETERESLDSDCWPGVSRNALELAAITNLWFDARADSTPLRREKPELHFAIQTPPSYGSENDSEIFQRSRKKKLVANFQRLMYTKSMAAT